MYFHNSIEEEQDFLSCKTKEDFERFIKEHPSSSYVSVARKRIETIQPSTQKSSEPSHETIPNKTRTAPIQTIIKEKSKKLNSLPKLPKKKRKLMTESYLNQPITTQPPKQHNRAIIMKTMFFMHAKLLAISSHILTHFQMGVIERKHRRPSIIC